MLTLKTKDLEFEAKLSLLNSSGSNSNNSNNLPPFPMEGVQLVSKEKLPCEQISNIIYQINFQKWYVLINLVIDDFSLSTVALVDSGADQNCIKEGLIPSKYYEKTKEQLYAAKAARNYSTTQKISEQ